MGGSILKRGGARAGDGFPPIASSLNPEGITKNFVGWEKTLVCRGQRYPLGEIVCAEGPVRV